MILGSQHVGLLSALYMAFQCSNGEHFVWSPVVLKTLAVSSFFTAAWQTSGSSVASFILFLNYCRLHSSALSHSDAHASAMDAFRRHT